MQRESSYARSRYEDGKLRDHSRSQYHSLNYHQATEKQKLSLDWLSFVCDQIISEIDETKKAKIYQAYKTRHGIRDSEDFKYLTHKYGIQYPARMMHIPLIDTHLEVLRGQQMLSSPDYNISCRDKTSLELAEKEKLESILYEIEQKVLNFHTSHLKHYKGGQSQTPPPPIFNVDTVLNEVEDHARSVKSSLEISAYYMSKFLEANLPIREIANTLFEDLIVTGSCFFRVRAKRRKEKPKVEAVNPMGFYHSKPLNSYYVNSAEKAVYLEYMQLTDVLKEWGDQLSTEDILDLEKHASQEWPSRVYPNLATAYAPLEGTAEENLSTKYVEVYHCEWKSVNKVEVEEDDRLLETNEKTKKGSKHYRLRQDLYSCVRLGSCTYVDYGRVEVQRSSDDPYYVPLTFNGVSYRDRNGEPYSLVLATKELSEKYDILHWYWENILALSGTKVTRVILENIPRHFGNSPAERLLEWERMVKNGIDAQSLSQEGASKEFANYNGSAIDMSLSSSSLDGILNMLNYLEELASKITGVPRQALGQISQSDGKATTERAMLQKDVITQPIFSLFEDAMRNLMKDTLNASRLCYEGGEKLSFALGNFGQKIFKLHPHFPLAEMDIYSTVAGKEQKKLDEFKPILPEMMAAGMISPLDFVDAYMADSLTEVREKFYKSQKGKNGEQQQQLQQQLEQQSEQMKGMEQELGKLQGMDVENRAKELSINERKTDGELSLKEAELELKREQGKDSNSIDLEYLQVEKEELSLQRAEKKESKNTTPPKKTGGEVKNRSNPKSKK